LLEARLGKQGKREYIQILRLLENKPPRLDLEQYPHLPVAQVATTSARDYAALLSEGF
jgi:hypothetical protein